MENFVLNLFKDQLSKIILNYNDDDSTNSAKTKINASFLAGKGSITNISLNVSHLNSLLSTAAGTSLPLRLTEVTLSELRLEVTSYTNLKKSPVVLVVDEVVAVGEEVLDFDHGTATEANDQEGGDAAAGVQSQQQAVAQAVAHQKQQQQKAQQKQYNLLHRIQDNLCIRINTIKFTFRPLGKFKTRQRGVWSPPCVAVRLRNVEWISVTQQGQVGTPEQIWSHNDLSAQQRNMRFGHRTYTIYKKLSMLGSIDVLDEGQQYYTNNKQKEGESTLISDCNIDMHVAYTRRLRDAAITGVDVDILCNDVDVNLDLSPSDASTQKPLGCKFQSVLHLLAGLQHCMYKDRSFVDPLLSESAADGVKSKGYDTPTKNSEEKKGEEELGPDDFMPVVNMEEDDDESSADEEEPDEEHDEAYLAWKKEQGMEVEPQVVDTTNNGVVETSSMLKVSSSKSLGDSLQTTSQEDEAPAKYKRRRKAVIVLASGAQKFEKLSFSLTVRKVNAKLFLPQDHLKSKGGDSINAVVHRHCLELLAEGIMVECIWPKPSGEIGGNVQCSLRYLHMMESLYRLNELGDHSVIRYLPLMKIGSRLFDGRDLFSLASHMNNMRNHTPENEFIDEDDQDGFPLMEKRQVSWKWARPSIRGPRAVSIKSTVSFVDEKFAQWSKTFVMHEANFGEIDICIDSDPISRLVIAVSTASWDDRWFSGEWLDEITPDMMAISQSDFYLKNHLQPIPGWYGSASGKLSALSSDLRSVTAKFAGIAVRLPHPVYSFSSCGLADVVCSISNSTVLVTSQLPVGFLSGTITASDGPSTSFPNDKGDLSCRDGSQYLSPEDTATNFRMQVTLSDFALEIVPIHELPEQHCDRNLNYLIKPTKITTLIHIQHTHPVQQSMDISGPPQIDQTILISSLIQRLESSIVIERAISAASTLKYHVTGIMDPCSFNKSLIVKADDGPTIAASVVCVHVSDFSINLASKGFNEDNVLQLVNLKLHQIEFGSESTVDSLAKDTITVQKCCLGGFSLQLISKNHEPINIVTTGTSLPDPSSPEDEEDVSSQCESNIMLRACHNSAHHSSSDTCHETTTFAVDIASPLIISLDVDAIKIFSDLAVAAFSAPVYFYSRSHSFESSTQSTMSALISMMFQVSSSLSSTSTSSKMFKSDDRGTVFNRMLINNLKVKIPSVTNGGNFFLAFEDIEVAAGHTGSISQLKSPILKHQCGRDNQWEHIVGRDISPDTFYAVKSKQSLTSVDRNGDRKVLLPAFVIDWNSNTGDKETKGLIDSSLTIGALMSYLSMKLYFLIPSTSSTRVASSDIHNLIGDYHSKMLFLLSNAEDTIEKLSLSLFAKERERVGMLSLVTPIVSGWLRICEGSGLSFHRLFSTPTLSRYWVAFNHSSLLMCYEHPGASTPILVFPISAVSTSLRVITIPLTSNAPLGIAGTHLQQKGFALVDSSSGTELFCVAGHYDEFKMWVSAISYQIKQSTADQGTATVDKPGEFELTKESLPSTEPCDQDTYNDKAPQDESSREVSENELRQPEIDNETSAMKTPSPVVENNENSDDTDGSSVEMETISLTGSLCESTNIVSTLELDATTEKPINTQTEQASPTVVQEPQEIKAPMPLSRDLLKKSRFASSKFNSALKSAKGGVIAASEKSRGGLRQALESNASSNAVANPGTDLGQRFSELKKSAAVKVTKLSSAVRTIMDEDAMTRDNPASHTAHKVEPPGLEAIGSESSALEFPNNSSVQHNRQEVMKKKLADLDQSMSNTMRRLKIDEKLNTISTAVRNAANESQVVARQLSNTNMSQSKNYDNKAQKSIKFDARETFSSHSDLPVRVKFIKAGHPLVLHNDEYLAEKSNVLTRAKGDWLVDVVVCGVEIVSLANGEHPEAVATESQPAQAGNVDSGLKLKKFKIISTDVGSGSVTTVSKSLTDVLLFHALISETFSTHFQCASEITHHEAAKGIVSMDTIFHRLSPLESIRVSGTILHGTLDASKSLSNISLHTKSYCEVIKAFLQTLVSSDLPPDALEATVDFLSIPHSIKEDSVLETTHHVPVPLTSRAAHALDVYENVATCTQGINKKHLCMANQSKAHDTDIPAVSSVLNLMMASYSSTVKERDEALAKLSASSILKDNKTVQRHRENNAITSSKSMNLNHDDELQMLCKNLGQEIELRTVAETEVRSLKERLKLEQELASAREHDLKIELEKYKQMLENTSGPK